MNWEFCNSLGLRPLAPKSDLHVVVLDNQLTDYNQTTTESEPMSTAEVFGTNVFWIDEALPDVVLPIEPTDGPYSEVYYLAQEYLADLGDERCQTLFVMVEVDPDADNKKRKPNSGLTHWDLINKQFSRYGYKVQQLFTEYSSPYNVQVGCYSRFL